MELPSAGRDDRPPRQHWELTVVTDFFAIAVWTGRGAAAVHRTVLHRVVDPKSEDRGHRCDREWILDVSDLGISPSPE